MPRGQDITGVVGGIPRAASADLLYKKGIYPYEYVDSWEKFSETSLPPKEEFYSSLTDEHITEEEYEHAQESMEYVSL